MRHRPPRRPRDPRRVDRLHRRASRRSSRSSTRARSTSRRASRSCATAGAGDPVLADRDRRRADLLGDRDPLGRGARTSRTRSRASACARRRLFALAARARHRARRHRHPSVGRLPRAAHHRHRALPPRRGGAAVRRVAQQHLRRCTSTSASSGADRAVRVLRPPAPRAAAAARGSAPTRPTSTGATPACTRRAPRSSPRPSRAAASPTRSAPGSAFADYVEFLQRSELDRRVHAGVVVGAPAPQLRHGRGAHLRRADHRGGVRRAGAPERRVRRPGRARRATRACRSRIRRARLIEENLWRAIRYGLDGRLIDLERGRGVPGAPRRVERLLAWTAPCAPSSGIERRAARAERRPAPAPADRAGVRDGRGLCCGACARHERPTPRR